VKLVNVRLILSLRCDQAAQLASEALDRKLTFSERWALRLHSAVCRACRIFSRQLRMIRELLAAMPQPWRERVEHRVVRLSSERRLQITRVMIEASRGDAT
jgi:hypothetical protein